MGSRDCSSSYESKCGALRQCNTSRDVSSGVLALEAMSAFVEEAFLRYATSRRLADIHMLPADIHVSAVCPAWRLQICSVPLDSSRNVHRHCFVSRL